MRGVLLNRDEQTDLPSPTPRRRAAFSKTLVRPRQINPRKSKWNCLDFLEFVGAESGLFNGLERIQIKKSFRLALPEKRACQGPHDFRQPGQDNTDSVSDKALVCKRLPLVAQGRQELESANRRRTTTSEADIRLWETWSCHRPRNVAHNRRCFAASIG